MHFNTLKNDILICKPTQPVTVNYCCSCKKYSIKLWIGAQYSFTPSFWKTHSLTCVKIK